MESALGRPHPIASVGQLCCCVDMAWATLMYGARTTCEWCVRREQLLCILIASTSEDMHSNDSESLQGCSGHHDHSYLSLKKLLEAADMLLHASHWLFPYVWTLISTFMVQGQCRTDWWPSKLMAKVVLNISSWIWGGAYFQGIQSGGQHQPGRALNSRKEALAYAIVYCTWGLTEGKAIQGIICSTELLRAPSSRTLCANIGIPANGQKLGNVNVRRSRK